MTAATTPDEHLRRIATPTRLGQYLAPRIWGADSSYDVDPWLSLAEERILDCFLDTKNQRFLRLHLPRQLGKSTYSGLFFPLWVLGMFPNTRITFIAYSDDYARFRGEETRNVMKAFGEELFGVQVDNDRDAKGDWGLKGHRGGMLSVGIGSQITGRSGDLIILDDVLKNMVEAASVATKSMHVREYDAAIRGGLQPGGTMLITSTRWADDDLAGVIHERTQAADYHGDEWEVISVPAIAEPEDGEEVEDEDEWRDFLGRQMGEPLQCRYTNPEDPWHESYFYKLRGSMDPFTFSCLFQQNPISSEDGMFPVSRWARYRREELPPMVATCRIWEPAATKGGGDWSIGMKLGKGTDGRFYILECYRRQEESDQVLAAAKSIGKADGYECEIGVEQEKAGAGKSVLTFWDKELAKEGLRVFPCKPEGSKEVRAKPASTLQLGGLLVIPDDEEQVEWVPVLIDQARRMMGDGRRGRHDDMVDAFAYGVMHLLDAGQAVFWDPSSVDEVQVMGDFMRDILGV